MLTRNQSVFLVTLLAAVALCLTGNSQHASAAGGDDHPVAPDRSATQTYHNVNVGPIAVWINNEEPGESERYLTAHLVLVVHKASLSKVKGSLDTIESELARVLLAQGKGIVEGTTSKANVKATMVYWINALLGGPGQIAEVRWSKWSVSSDRPPWPVYTGKL